MTETTKRKVYGIDLGTTYSAISFIDEFGKAQVIPNSDNERITPSVVFFENEKNIVVGTGAIVSAPTDPDRVVTFVKRQMHDPEWSFNIDGNSYKPEAVSALILKRLAEDAAKTGEHDVKDVVITVPAYFGALERERTKLAGELANLNVIEILDEPVAAAINYGLNEESKGKNIIVYDLGGGTFDVTVVKIGGDADKNEISIVCTLGNHELGGKDWDDRIVQFLVAEFRSQTGSEENILAAPDTAYDLQTKAEQYKKMLSKKDCAPMVFQHEGQKIRADLTLEKFEELTVDLVEQTIALTDKVLELAKEKGVSKIDTFLLVGGSTRMKQIKTKLTEKYQPMLGVAPIEFDVDEAVAKGAAKAGEIHVITNRLDQEKQKEANKQGIDLGTATPEEKKKVTETAMQNVADAGGYTLTAVKTAGTTVLQKVATKSYGVQALNKARQSVIYNIIVSQTPIPVKGTLTGTGNFGTADANADALDIVVYMNNGLDREATLESGTILGQAEFKLDGNLPKDAPIEITFELDEQGLLTLTGLDKTHGKKVTAKFQSEGIMSEQERKKVQSELAVQTVS